MGRKLTQKEFEEKVFQCVGDRFSVISEYKGKIYPVTLRCNIHNIDFSATADCFMRGPSNLRCNCPICSQLAKIEKQENHYCEVTCAYCGKNFSKLISKMNSKSGLYFCCRQHKDMAQRLDSDNKFKIIRPKHYGTLENGTESSYRTRAFKVYPHQCAVCGWNEDEDLLEVHHIDEDRNNNHISNLKILCPLCHRKITSHKYYLNENQILKF